MEILLVTGMSGAGKSNVVYALEDIGYFCADNIPPNLMIPFFKEFMSNHEEYEKVAIIIDVRAGLSFKDFKSNIDKAKSIGIDFKILFIDCDDDTLLRRFKETRRLHPLLKDTNYSMLEAIVMERQLLQPIKEIADIVVDSTYLSVIQFRERIKDYFLAKPEDSFSIHFISFGYKHGIPRDSDLVFDVRCLPNPYYIPELKYKTGVDKEVSDFVLSDTKSKELINMLTKMLIFLFPLYKSEGKSQLVVCFGCTGGHHRSVTFAEYYSKLFSDMGYKTTVEHRDIKK